MPARNKTDQASKVTTDHGEIRRWVEERSGHPACVKGTGEGEPGVLRIDYPSFTGDQTLQRISWDEWFDKFDGSNLAFLYQEETADGGKSRFSKLVARETKRARPPRTNSTQRQKPQMAKDEEAA